MHLVYVIDSLVPGGAERSLAAMAPHYVARGIDLEVVYLHDRPGLQSEFERAGVALHAVGGSSRVDWVRRILAVLTRLRPELVHTTLFESDVSGRAAARRAGVPVVSSLVSEHYGAAHFGNPALRRWKLRGAQVLDATTARFAIRMHAVSEVVADSMARNLRYPRDRIEVIPRGRDPEVLGVRTGARRAAARDRLGIPSTDRIVLAVARQEHAKGLDVLLAAMPDLQRKVAGVHLLVAGQAGGATGDLQGSVDRGGLGESVTFLGGRDDVPELLCAADVFVLPSRREGAPGSVIEAMALELPIVVSDLPQVREIVDEQCARLVPPDAPQLLASALAEALSDPPDSERRAHRARQRFLTRFTIERIADEMVEFYERALRFASARREKPR